MGGLLNAIDLDQRLSWKLQSMFAVEEVEEFEKVEKVEKVEEVERGKAMWEGKRSPSLHSQERWIASLHRVEPDLLP